MAKRLRRLCLQHGSPRMDIDIHREVLSVAACACGVHT